LLLQDHDDQVRKLEDKVKLEEERVRTYDAMVESHRNMFRERQAETAEMVARNRMLIKQIEEKNALINEYVKIRTVLTYTHTLTLNNGC